MNRIVGRDKVKRISIALLVGLTMAGCQTVSPVQQVIQKSRMTLGFNDVPLAECIIFLVADVNTGWQSPKGSIGLIQQPDPKKDTERAKFEGLREFCGGKKITLHVDNCAPLDLLTFLTKCAGVAYEFRGDRIVILLPDGQVLGTERAVANQASEAIGAEDAPQPER